MILKYNDLLLIAMLTTYSYTIYNVYINYKINHDSISSIIKQNKCNGIVFYSMCLMCILTIIYELSRYNFYSFYSIILVLVGIIGIILYDHTQYNLIHYFFVFIIFLNILLFMITQSCLKKKYILYFLLCIQLILSCLILLTNYILNYEIFLLINFAIFYLYLHYITYC